MSDILVEKIGAVTKITLNDPNSLNALSDDMQFELLRLVNETALDNSVRAVLITGAGKGFCAGGNVKKMAGKIAESAEIRAEAMRQKHQVAIRIQHSPKIFIAAVNGACFGAGLGLAMTCDFRFAARSARFGTAFAKIGLSGDFGVTWTLTQLVGTAKARELMILCEPFDAAKAKDLGIVNEVLVDDKLADRAMEFAQRIASGPTVAYGYIKHNLLAATTSSIEEAIQTEVRSQMHAIRADDHREAVSAFGEKRPPVYTGT